MKHENYPHHMIDLETLGTQPGAPIIAIGICGFDPDTGAIGEGMEVTVDFDKACQPPFEVSGATIRWWLQQSEDARAKVTRGKHSVHGALAWLDNYLSYSDKKNLCVWGNGSTFDISILEYAFRQEGIPVPWSFRNVRDVRTIIDVASPFVDRDTVPFQGTKHSALDDAKHQARYVSAMWQALREGTQPVNRSPDQDTFFEDLRFTINKHSLEKYSGTPDYVLANHLLQSLKNYEATIRARADFLGS